MIEKAKLRQIGGRCGNLTERKKRGKRGGQAHFAPKTPQNELVPGGFRVWRSVGWALLPVQSYTAHRELNG